MKKIILFLLFFISCTPDFDYTENLNRWSEKTNLKIIEQGCSYKLLRRDFYCRLLIENISGHLSGVNVICQKEYCYLYSVE